jgi:hypothetical protein
LGLEDFKYKIERMIQRKVRPRVEDIIGEYAVTESDILEKLGPDPSFFIPSLDGMLRDTRRAATLQPRHIVRP